MYQGCQGRQHCTNKGGTHWKYSFLQVEIKEEKEHIGNERPHPNSITSGKIISANSSAEFGLLINLINLKLAIHIVNLIMQGNTLRSYLTIFFRKTSSSAED